MEHFARFAPSFFRDVESNIRNWLSANSTEVPIVVKEYVDRLFQTGPDGKFAVGRFSDGLLPVCYTADDETTAVHEVTHHRDVEYRKVILSMPESDRHSVGALSYSLALITLSIDGQIANLVGRPGMPFLTGVEAQQADAYAACRSLAKLLKQDKLADGLRTPSARRSGSICYPIFQRGSISEPGIPVSFIPLKFDVVSMRSVRN